METSYRLNNAIRSLWFRSYLWGMETIHFALAHKQILSHSDPTYEAWKRENSTSARREVSEFRSYLWGMETYDFEQGHTLDLSDSDPTYEAWKQKSILSHILPHTNSDPTYEAWKHGKG